MSRIPVSSKDRLRGETSRRIRTDFNNKNSSSSVIAYTGGGLLQTTSVNELRDTDTYSFPIAGDYKAGKTIGISLPETYKAETPTIEITGIDTVTSSAGTDTEFKFDSDSWGLFWFTSDGIDDWSV